MNQLFVLLLTLQLIYAYVAAIAIPGNNTRNHEDEAVGNSAANFSTNIVTTDETWCDKNIGGVNPGDYKPVKAICDFDVPSKFTAYCKPQHNYGNARPVGGSCPLYSSCFQRNDVVMWNGQLGTDVDCRWTNLFKKWGVGTMVPPLLPKGTTCSPRIKRTFSTADLTTFSAVYVDGVSGARQTIQKAWIILDNWISGVQYNVDSYKHKERLWHDTDVQFCEYGGFSTVTEGYGWMSPLFS